MYRNTEKTFFVCFERGDRGDVIGYAVEARGRRASKVAFAERGNIAPKAGEQWICLLVKDTQPDNPRRGALIVRLVSRVRTTVTYSGPVLPNGARYPEDVSPYGTEGKALLQEAHRLFEEGKALLIEAVKQAINARLASNDPISAVTIGDVGFRVTHTDTSWRAVSDRLSRGGHEVEVKSDFPRKVSHVEMTAWYGQGVLATHQPNGGELKFEWNGGDATISFETARLTKVVNQDIVSWFIDGQPLCEMRAGGELYEQCCVPVIGATYWLYTSEELDQIRSGIQARYREVVPTRGCDLDQERHYVERYLGMMTRVMCGEVALHVTHAPYTTTEKVEVVEEHMFGEDVDFFDRTTTHNRFLVKYGKEEWDIRAPAYDGYGSSYVDGVRAFLRHMAALAADALRYADLPTMEGSIELPHAEKRRAELAEIRSKIQDRVNAVSAFLERCSEVYDKAAASEKAKAEEAAAKKAEAERIAKAEEEARKAAERSAPKRGSGKYLRFEALLNGEVLPIIIPRMDKWAIQTGWNKEHSLTGVSCWDALREWVLSRNELDFGISPEELDSRISALIKGLQAELECASLMEEFHREDEHFRQTLIGMCWGCSCMSTLNTGKYALVALAVLRLYAKKDEENGLIQTIRKVLALQEAALSALQRAGVQRKVIEKRVKRYPCFGTITSFDAPTQTNLERWWEEEATLLTEVLKEYEHPVSNTSVVSEVKEETAAPAAPVSMDQLRSMFGGAKQKKRK